MGVSERFSVELENVKQCVAVQSLARLRTLNFLFFLSCSLLNLFFLFDRLATPTPHRHYVP